MQQALEGGAGREWQQEALRRSAMAASPDSRRSLYVAAAALVATVLFGLGLVFLPGGFGLTGPGLDALRPFVEQTRRLPTGDISAERLETLAHPLWLLLGRYSGDLALAALVLSGISAVVSLFMVYQLCHGLAGASHADEQACYALLGLALTPTFFLAAAGGGTELPHLALVLWALVCVQRALQSESPMVPMSMAGLFFGLSLLIRPISLLVPLAMLIWLVAVKPFGQGDRLRPMLGFAAAYIIGAVPTLLLHLIYHTSPVSWGPADLAALGGRFIADPLRFVLATGETLAQYVAADDVERLAGVSGSWLAGDWLALPGAMIALAPTILKLLGVVGLGCLLWVERFEAGLERTRLPMILLAVFLVGGGLGFAEERSLLLMSALLVVFAFAGLPGLMPGPVGGVTSLALIGFLVVFQFGGAQLARQSAPFKASDRVAAELRAVGATPNRVMSASWTFYDTRSPWKERYLHLPAYVDSTDALIREMKRQGARYVVFDRQTGANHWPRLAGLLENEPAGKGLRALGPAIGTLESPPNMIAIYTLE